MDRALEFKQAISEGRVEDVRRILAAQPSRDSEPGGTPVSLLKCGYGRYKETALHLAVKNSGEDTCIAKLLLERPEVDVNAVDGHKRTALHIAADRLDRETNINIIKLLLDQKDINIDGEEKFGNTPLKLAAEKGNLKVVKMLIVHGADATKADKARNTAIHVAARKGHYEVLMVLLSGGQMGRVIGQQNNNNETPLHLAAERKCRYSVAVLLQHGAEATITTEDLQGQTPIQHANGDGNILRLLENPSTAGKVVQEISDLERGQVLSDGGYQGDVVNVPEEDRRDFQRYISHDGQTTVIINKFNTTVSNDGIAAIGPGAQVNSRGSTAVAQNQPALPASGSASYDVNVTGGAVSIGDKSATYVGASTPNSPSSAVSSWNENPFIYGHQEMIAKQCNPSSTGASDPIGTADHTGNASLTRVVGPTGTAGPTGAFGPTGTAGHTGTAGPTGTAGHTGTHGPTETAGPTGAFGPTGTAGHTGAVDPTGSAGPTGAVGPTGTAGPTGAAGPTGTSNPMGVYDPGGASGSTGANGPTGTAGTNPSENPDLTGAAAPAGTSDSSGTYDPRGTADPTGASDPKKITGHYATYGLPPMKSQDSSRSEAILPTSQGSFEGQVGASKVDQTKTEQPAKRGFIHRVGLTKSPGRPLQLYTTHDDSESASDCSQQTVASDTGACANFQESGISTSSLNKSSRCVAEFSGKLQDPAAKTESPNVSEEDNEACRAPSKTQSVLFGRNNSESDSKRGLDTSDSFPLLSQGINSTEETRGNSERFTSESRVDIDQHHNVREQDSCTII